MIAKPQCKLTALSQTKLTIPSSTKSATPSQTQSTIPFLTNSASPSQAKLTVPSQTKSAKDKLTSQNSSSPPDSPVSVSSSPVHTKSWIKSSLFSLEFVDKAILESTEWLNDRIVNPAQNILKLQFGGIAGWQQTLFEQAPSKFAVIEDGKEFIQIILVGKSHWITVSSIGCGPGTLNVYDSLHSSIGSATVKQICSFWRCSTTVATIRFINIQRQLNSNDCGLHAIACATELAHSNDPVVVYWNTECMRKHLLDGLVQQHLNCFPQLRTRRVPASNRYRNVESKELFCICKMPNDPKLAMIRCDCCKMWYHKGCMKMTWMYHLTIKDGIVLNA